ncbi:MAG: hypothetical protein H0W70_02675 [Actinobacteria bacterium]|nr:hypothetical protein [Actinomycetota bacterium]
MSVKRAVPLVVGGAVALLGVVGLPLGGVAGIAVAVAMGALFGDDAFAAGALVSVPSAAVAIVLAVTRSVAWTAFLVVFTPVSIVLSGVLGRVGAVIVGLVRPIDAPAGALPGSIAAVKAQQAVEQRRRGIALVVVFASVAVMGWATDNRVNAAADRRARDVQPRLVAARPVYFADDLYKAKNEVGAWVTLRRGPPFAMVAEVTYGWAVRCVVRQLDEPRRVYIEERRQTC